MKNEIKKVVPNLICHPLAIPAFEFTQFLFCREQVCQPTPERLKLFARTRKLQFHRKEQNKLFFVGWIPLLLNDEFTFRKEFVGHPNNVEFDSWLYALDSIIALSNINNFLPNLAHFFDCAPDYIQGRLFCGKNPTTTLAKVIKFSGASRASVRHHLRNMEGEK